MKQVIVVMSLVIASCSSPPSPVEQNNKIENEHAAGTVMLKNGSKWKADETTKKNVAAMVMILNDKAYQPAGKRSEMLTSIQSQIDTLVKQCSMKGREHDALHAWLENVLVQVNNLKNSGDDFPAAYATLQKAVASFYDFFE